MVSLPALLAEAPHIPYKLELSFESCDSPTPTHLVIWRRGMDVDMSRWNGNFRAILSFHVMSIYVACCDLCSHPAVMSVEDQQGPCERSSRRETLGIVTV